MPPPGARPLDNEAIHEVAMIIADALQNYIEKKEGKVGFLELKIGVINALECLFQYQHKVMIVPPRVRLDKEGLPPRA